MANSITEARVQQYKANITMLYQQKMSKLRKIGRVEYVVGKQAFFERLAPSASLEKTVCDCAPQRAEHCRFHSFPAHGHFA